MAINPSATCRWAPAGARAPLVTTRAHHSRTKPCVPSATPRRLRVHTLALPSLPPPPPLLPRRSSDRRTRRRSRYCTAAAGSNGGNIEAAFGIFDAPGLGPSRSERQQRSGPFSRLTTLLHRALAAVCPPLASSELLRRAAVTLCMLCLIRLGHYIPTPGLDLSLLLQGATTGPESLSKALTGSGELPGNIFLLSITPLMSAYFCVSIAQLIPEARRHLNLLREGGRRGRETINLYILLLFWAFAVGQAVTESAKLLPLAAISTAAAAGAGKVAAAAVAAGGKAAAAAAALPSTLGFRVQAGVTLMAGAVVCKHAVQCVDQWGLGDGTGTVIGAGIALGYAKYLSVLIPALQAAPPPPLHLAAAVGLCAALVAATVWVQATELRLPLSFFSPRRSRALLQHPVLTDLTQGVDSGAALEAQSRLPLRLSPQGTRQLLFTNFWVGMLEGPLSVVGLAGALQNPWNFAALVFCLEGFSVGDATPRQLSDFLAQSDMGLRGLSPGADTEAFLALRRRQLKLLNAAFVAGVSLACRAVDAACSALTGLPFGCLNILLLVSTVLSAARQADALSRGPKVERMIAADLRVLEEVATQHA